MAVSFATPIIQDRQIIGVVGGDYDLATFSNDVVNYPPALAGG